MALLALVFLFVYLYIFDKKADAGGDNFAYYGLGKAIRHYGEYFSLWAPDAHRQNHFQPGYPLILAVFMFISEDPVFLVAINGVFLLVSVLLLFGFMKKASLKPSLAFAISVVLLFNGALLKYSTIMMSEISYLLLTCLVLYLCSVIDFSKRFFANPLFYVLVAAIVASIYVRTQGISILFAVLVFMAFERKWLYALGTAGLSILGILPWNIRSQQLGGNSYVTQFLSKNPYDPHAGNMDLNGLIERVLHNLERYITVEIPNGVLSTNIKYTESYTSSQWALGLFILAVALFGVIRFPRKYRFLLLGLLVGTFGIVLMWPEQWFGARFMFNTIPILLMLFIFGIYEAIHFALKKLTGGLSPYFLLAFILLFTREINELHKFRATQYAPGYAAYIKIAEWAKQNTAESAIFAVRKPEMFFFFSDRRCTHYQFVGPEELLTALEKVPVDYVVVDQLGYSSTPRFLIPAIQKYPNRFKLIHQIPNPDTYLFQFVK